MSLSRSRPARRPRPSPIPDQFRRGQSRPRADRARRDVLGDAPGEGQQHDGVPGEQRRTRFRRRSSASSESLGESPSRSASRWTRRRWRTSTTTRSSSRPSQNFSLANLYGVGLVQSLDQDHREDSPPTRDLQPRHQHGAPGRNRATRDRRARTRSAVRPACWQKRPDRRMPIRSPTSRATHSTRGEAAARFRSRSARESRTRRLSQPLRSRTDIPESRIGRLPRAIGGLTLAPGPAGRQKRWHAMSPAMRCGVGAPRIRLNGVSGRHEPRPTGPQTVSRRPLRAVFARRRR